MSVSSRAPERCRGIARPGMLVAVSVVIAFGALRVLSPLGFLESRTIDFRFHVRGTRAPDPRLVIVAIDEATLSAFRRQGGRLDEWPRARHAALVRQLSRCGAAVIGWDVVFGERSAAPADDETFARSLRKAGNVVLPMYGSQSVEEGGEGDRTVLFDPGAQSWLETHGLKLAARPDAPVNAYGWSLPPPALRTAAADVGFLDIAPDADSVYRHVQLLRGDNLGRWREHIAAAAFRRFAQGPAGTPRDRDMLRQVLARPGGRALIDFAGPPGTIPRLSYVDVLNGAYRPDQVHGKLVLVGRTGVSEDIRPNPFSPTANGIEITAGALNSLLTGRFLRMPAWPFELLTELFLAGAAVLLMGCLRPWPALAAITGAVLAYVAISAWIFGASNLVLPVVGPMLALGLAAGGALHSRLSEEEAARRRIQSRWESYVGPDVLQEILSNPALDSRQGIQAEVTVVFSDIRGYSTLSERCPAEQVIQQLNEHFQEVNPIVFACGGTVLGVTGDGLLLIFGWPRTFPDHAARAVAAVRAIAETLSGLNAHWESRGMPTIDIGFGVHSGPVVAGRVGGEQGSQLTVIGDTVNIAARVEETNKRLGTRILVTRETRLQLGPGVRFGKTETVPIRGREGSMEVWEVLHRDTVRGERLTH